MLLNYNRLRLLRLQLTVFWLRYLHLNACALTIINPLSHQTAGSSLQLGLVPSPGCTNQGGWNLLALIKTFLALMFPGMGPVEPSVECLLVYWPGLRQPGHTYSYYVMLSINRFIIIIIIIIIIIESLLIYQVVVEQNWVHWPIYWNSGKQIELP